jgi:hypothetical protein
LVSTASTFTGSSGDVPAGTFSERADPAIFGRRFWFAGIPTLRFGGITRFSFGWLIEADYWPPESPPTLGAGASMGAGVPSVAGVDPSELAVPSAPGNVPDSRSIRLPTGSAD